MNVVTELILVLISAALVNNVILSQFLGLCPFLGVSKKVETAAGMGVAVIFVITIASAVCSAIYMFILDPLDLTYLNTIVFILVIAALVQLVEMVLKKSMPSLYKALGVYLPLITTNCAVLGVALTNVQKYADGNLMLGPTAQDVADKEDTATSAEGLAAIRASVTQTVPKVRLGRVITSFAGLRAVSGEDFIIQASKVAPGSRHLRGSWMLSER